MTRARRELVEDRLARRQPDLTVLLDGVHKPHNLGAIVRSCDAVGVMAVHTVPPRGGVRVPRTAAQGSQKWVELVRHRNLAEAVARLRGEGLALVAAHPDDSAVDFREPDYTAPTAFVLGTERLGVSAEALAACTLAVRIPMQGMVESLNVSVAAALLLFEAQRQRLAAGLYERRQLDAARFEALRFEWLHPHIARRCRERGWAYPPLDEDGDLAAAPGP